MSDVQAILDSAMNDAVGISPEAGTLLAPVSAPVIVPVGRNYVPQGVDGYKVAARIASGIDRPLTQEEQDLHALTPYQLEEKYGMEGAQKVRSGLSAGLLHYGQDISTSRSAGGAILDNVKGVLGLVGSSAVGIVGMGVGMIDPQTGAKLANSANELTEWVNSAQTPELQAHRQAAASRAVYRSAEEADKYKADLDNGSGDLVAKMHNFGRGLIGSFKDTLSDPMLLEQGTVDNAGAILVNYALTAGLGELASVITPGVRAAGVLSEAESIAARGAAQITKAAMVGDTALTASEAIDSYGTGLQTVGRLAGKDPYFTGLADKWIPRVSQGIQMGGMAHQAAVANVMGRSFDDLQQTSQVYRDALTNGLSPEDARLETAGKAGRIAAIIAGPLAGSVAGISHLSEHPFTLGDVPTATELATGAVMPTTKERLLSSAYLTGIKQPVEGGIVNAGQTLAGNIAMKAVVDPSHPIDEGLGTATGEGAIYGLTAAAGMQALSAGPALAGKTAVGAMVLGAKGFKAASSKYDSVVKNRADKIQSKADTESPVSRQNLSEAADVLLKNAPVDSATISGEKVAPAAGSVKSRAEDWSNAFYHKLAFTPYKEGPDGEGWDATTPEHLIAPGIDPKTKQPVTNRLDAIGRYADAAKVETDPIKKAELLRYTHDLLEDLAPFRNIPEEVTKTFKPGTATHELLTRFQTLATKTDQMPEIKHARESVAKVMEERDPSKIEPIKEEEIGTPVGKAKLADITINAELAPHVGNIPAIDEALAHYEAGRIELSPTQLASLKESRGLLEARQKFIDGRKALGLSKSEQTSDQILTGEYDERKDTRPSALQFLKRIHNFAAQGDNEAAKAELHDMGQFVQHTKNHIEALNTHLAGGDSKAPGVPYQALNSRTTYNGKLGQRNWFTSTETKKSNPTYIDPMVRPGSEPSVKLARDVANDHEALATAYNGIVDAYPQLGERKIALTHVHPAIDGDTVSNVAEAYRTGARRSNRFAEPYKTQVEAEKAQQAKFDGEKVPLSVDPKPVETPTEPVKQTVTSETAPKEDLSKWTPDELSHEAEVYRKIPKEGRTPEQVAHVQAISDEVTKRESVEQKPRPEAKPIDATEETAKVKTEMKQRYVAAGEKPEDAEILATIHAGVLNKIGEQEGMSPTEAMDVYAPKIRLATDKEVADRKTAKGLPEKGNLRGWFEHLPDNTTEIVRTSFSNLPTMLHEAAHSYLDMLEHLANKENASETIKSDWNKILNFLGAGEDGLITGEQHEMWARANEQYFREGKAPNASMKGVFARIADWMTSLYKQAGHLGVPLSDDIREVFDRLYAGESSKARQVDEALPSKLTIQESTAKGYRERTINNVNNSDVTVAFATDYTTSGEVLTQRTAQAAGKYVQSPLTDSVDKAATDLIGILKKRGAHVINIAGNGIQTLSRGGEWSQEKVNQYIYDVLKKVHEEYPISKIISGGQTGVDLAGLVAAHKLGIEAVGTLPKGFLQRDVKGDATHSQQAIHDQVTSGSKALKELAAPAQSAAPTEAPTPAPVETPAPVTDVPPAVTETPASTLPAHFSIGSGAAEPEGERTLKSLLPKLISTVENFFHKAMALRDPKNPTTRTEGVDSPVDVVRQGFASDEAYKGVTEGKTKMKLDPEVGEAFKKLLWQPSNDAERKQFQFLMEKFSAGKLNAKEAGRFIGLNGIMAAMYKNLHTYLDKSYSQSDPSTRAVWLNEDRRTPDDSTLNRMSTGKILNLLEPDGNGSFNYNQNLLESAIMAGLHWYLTVGHTTPRVRDRAMESITGLDFVDIQPNIRAGLDNSYSAKDIKDAMANRIKEFWGMKSNNDTNLAYAEGIPEAVASEVFRAMMDLGMFRQNDVLIYDPVQMVTNKKGESVPKVNKKFPRFRPNDMSEVPEAGAMLQKLFLYPDGLADVIVKNPTRTIHFGDDVPATARFQMHTDVPNTKSQASAITNANAVKYGVNMPLTNLYFALGRKFMFDRFAGGHDLDSLPTNKAHKIILEGMNITLGSALNHIGTLMNLMHSRSEVTQEAIEAMIVHIEHNMSKVGRMQQTEAVTPQGNKNIRNILTPTWSTLDMVNNNEHRTAFWMAVSQALGTKAEKGTPDEAAAEAFRLLEFKDGKPVGPLAEVQQVLDKWAAEQHAAETLQGYPGTDIQEDSALGRQLHDAIEKSGKGEKFSQDTLSAMTEVARFKALTTDAERSAFRTSHFLEADGKANGVTMAMMMLATGEFTAAWLKNVRRGGIEVNPDPKHGENGAPMHALGDEAKVDLYKVTAGETQTNVSKRIAKYETDPSASFLRPVHKSLVRLMDRYLPGFSLVPGEDGKLTLNIERDLTKNPVQKTVYGSGLKGVAGGVTDTMLGSIYEHMTQAARLMKEKGIGVEEALFPDDANSKLAYHDFLFALNKTMEGQIHESREGVFSFHQDTRTRDAHVPITEINPLTFELSKGSIENLNNNMLHTLVEPMNRAIETTVGKDVMDASRLIQTSTNLQSVVYSNVVKYGFEEKIKAKLAEPGTTFKKNEFLSQNEIDDIIAKASGFAPTIQTNDQTFLTVKDTRYSNEDVQYSKTLDDKFGTPASTRIPGAVGVGAIADLNIGMGDGHTMQTFYNAPHKGEGTLGMFDGLGMPLDRITEYSRSINAAAQKAMMNNPVRAVRDAYFKMLGRANLIHWILDAQHQDALDLAKDPKFLKDNAGLSKTDLLKAAMDKKMVLATELTKAIHDTDVRDIHNWDNNTELSNWLMDSLHSQSGELNRSSRMIDSHHQVMSEIGWSSDQMATAAAPSHNGIHGPDGVVDKSSDEATAIDMEARRQEVLKTLPASKKVPEFVSHEQFLGDKEQPALFTRKELKGFEYDSRTEPVDELVGETPADTEVPPPAAVQRSFSFMGPEGPAHDAMADKTLAVGRGDDTGVRVLSPTAVRKLSRIIGLNTDQQEIMSQIFKSAGFQSFKKSASERAFKVITGTKEAMMAYARKFSSATAQNMLGKDGILHGFMVPGERTIYLINPSAETFVHEMIHATTFDTVMSHYTGVGDLKPETHNAVNEIANMMKDFMADASGKYAMDLSKETSDVLVQLRKYIPNGFDSPHASPDNKARAINEYMAWTLSNRELNKQAKGTFSTPETETKKASFFQSMKDSLIQKIKNIVWGTQRSINVGNDVFSNLKFNTGIVMRDRPTIVDIMHQSTMTHLEMGGEERLAGIRNFQNTMINRHLDDIRNIPDNERVYINSLPNRTPEEKLARTEEIRRVRATRRIDEQVALEKDITRITTEISDHFRSSFRMDMNELTAFNQMSQALTLVARYEPSFLNRAAALHLHVMKNISPESFMDPNLIPGTEVYENNRPYAESKYNTIIGREALSEDPRTKESSMLPTFVALSMIDPSMRRVLSKIEMPQINKSDAKSMVDREAFDLANKGMEWLSSKFSGEGKAHNISEAMNALADTVTESVQSEKSYLDMGASKIGGVIDAVNDGVVNLLGYASDKGVAAGRALQTKNNNFAKNLGGIISVLSGALSDKNADAAAEGVISYINRMPLRRAIDELAVDLVGRTSSNAGVYDMIKQVKARIAQLRQSYVDHIPEQIQSYFTEPLTSEIKTHLFHSFGKADAASLMDGNTNEEVLKLLGDRNARVNKVTQLEDQLQATDPNNFNLYQKKMHETADYMMTGKTASNLLLNAYSIADLLNEQGTSKISMNPKTPDLVHPDRAKTIKAIDQLTTLYALEHLDEARQGSLSDLVQKQPAGMKFLLDYVSNQRKDELTKVTGDKLLEYNHYKGHIPSDQEFGSSLRVADDSTLGELRAQGYTRMGNYKGSNIDGHQEERGYYFSPLNGRTAYAQGIMQNIDHTASGIDSTTGFSMRQVAGRITNPKLVERITKQAGRESVNGEHLLPRFDEKGQIYAYERTMDPKMLAMRNPSEDITKMLGVWRGRQVEEEMSKSVNHALVDKVHKMWLDAHPGTGIIDRRNEYVNLMDTKTLDPVTRDAVRLFNTDTQNYIESKFGKDTFMVRRDLLNDVIGYRHASIGDMWTGNTRWSKPVQDAVRNSLTNMFGIDAYKHLVNKEQMVQGFMADARRGIAVKSMVVPTMNLVSNLYQLSGRGVPPESIKNGFALKLTEIHNYNKFRLREIELEGEIHAAKNDPRLLGKLEAEKLAINDSYKRMSIYPLLKNGEFSTIAGIGESADDLELSSGHVMQWLENQVDKLPDGVRTAARYGIVARDTALYQGLERLAEYGDFIAKGIYYDDLTKRKGMRAEDALAHITDEYVNYDRLQGRGRSYLDNMGLMWFYNYKVRIAKVALSMMRNNPVHALIAGHIPAFAATGSIIHDNIFAKLLDGHLKYSLGPQMAIHGLTMSPFTALIR